MNPVRSKKLVKTPLIITIIVSLALSGAFWYFYQSADNQDLTLNSNSQGQTLVTALTQTYTDPAQHFSFNYPEGYTVREVPSDGTSRTPALSEVEVLVIEGSSLTAGIQIIITPDDTNTDITAEAISEAIPDMKVENPQSFPVGANSGLAFQSDNSAFDGASREVWFASNGYLYQISAYASNDQLLAAIFATWKLLK